MITNDERREVAARLRSLDDERIAGKIALNDTWTFLDVLDETLFGERKFKMWHTRLGYITSRLADLIEPSIPSDPGEAGLASVDGFIREMRHSTKEEQNAYNAMLEKMSVEMHPVDRDALLALADELDKEAEHKESSCYDRSVATVGTRYVREISRRIRGALGVEDA